jgi:hypothetical protein
MLYKQTGNAAAATSNSTTDADGTSVITSSRGGLDIRASVMFPPVTLLPGSVLLGSIPRGQVKGSQSLTLGTLVVCMCLQSIVYSQTNLSYQREQTVVNSKLLQRCL